MFLQLVFRLKISSHCLSMIALILQVICLYMSPVLAVLAYWCKPSYHCFVLFSSILLHTVGIELELYTGRVVFSQKNDCVKFWRTKLICNTILTKLAALIEKERLERAEVGKFACQIQPFQILQWLDEPPVFVQHHLSQGYYASVGDVSMRKRLFLVGVYMKTEEKVLALSHKSTLGKKMLMERH